jgi:hypothetical protein
MSREHVNLHLSGTDRLLEELMQADFSMESDLIERIQTIIYHQAKRFNKERAQQAEKRRQAAIADSISTMRDWKATSLNIVASGLTDAGATGAMAPKGIHGLASRVMDVSQYNMTDAKHVQKFSDLINRTCGGYSGAFNAGGDIMGKRNEATRMESQAWADVCKTAQDEQQASSKEEGNRADDCRNRANEKRQHRHRLFGELAGR